MNQGFLVLFLCILAIGLPIGLLWVFKNANSSKVAQVILGILLISILIVPFVIITWANRTAVAPTITPVLPTATKIHPTIVPTPASIVTPNKIPITSFNATVIDQANAQINVTKLQAFVYSTCDTGLIYVGVPTTTEFYWDFISLNVGEYIVDIPFEIIRNITVQQGEPLYQYAVTVTLSDGTVLQGEDDAFANGTDLTPLTLLVGESDLGGFLIEFWNVKEITPVQDPQLSFAASASGTNPATLTLSDGNQINLEYATFYAWETNDNGCYLDGERYNNSIGFDTIGGATFQVSWDKIKSIIFTRREFHSDEFKLTTLSGDELAGRANNMSGVEGIANFGSFTLKVRVPFTSTAISLTFDN